MSAHLFDKLRHCEGSPVNICVVVTELKLLHFIFSQCSGWLIQSQLLNNAECQSGDNKQD